MTTVPDDRPAPRTRKPQIDLPSSDGVVRPCDEHDRAAPGLTRLESGSITCYALPLYQTLIASVSIPFELPLPLE